ncbi:hypothetical protein LAL4801_00268 [Roseibium aggregatum]|uniref:Uncharacterized protein n=1 Tax=Roseibium aggregatum TaxID=187304 RepID=A0A0M6XXV6_9HYPH|nr:hypothetical protein LAL4801_00268 [Roseibium aggregatum]
MALEAIAETGTAFPCFLHSLAQRVGSPDLAIGAGVGWRWDVI